MIERQVDRAMAVIVVNYGSSELLAENLLAVHQDLDPALIVVVDNFSNPAEREAVTALSAANGWLLVTNECNLGFGAGMNAGVERALQMGAARLLLLNPDATIDSASVRLMGERINRFPLALVGPLIRRPDGRLWSMGHVLSLSTGDIYPRGASVCAEDEVVPWLSGACLLLSSALWRATGGFDERYFLYWEDIDFSTRVARAGGEIEFEPDALAIHDEGATHRASDERSAKSATYYYYNIVNRLRYAALHLDEQGMRRWLRSAPASSWRILLRGGRRQFLRPMVPLAAAGRGYRAGRGLVRQSLRAAHQDGSRS